MNERIQNAIANAVMLATMLGIAALAIAGSAEAQQVPVPKGGLVIVEA